MGKILTPTDFAQSMSGELYQKEILFHPNPDFEPEFRKTLDLIFNDLPYVDSEDSWYFDSIEEPLSNLRDWMIQIIAVQQRGNYRFGNSETIPMVKTIYYIAPEPCYFQNVNDSNSLVHVLGASCATCSRILATIKASDALKLWFSRSPLETDFEKEIPWCPECLSFDLATIKEKLKVTDLQKYLPNIRIMSSKGTMRIPKDEIEEGESETREFKQTLRMNIKTNQKDSSITHAVLKTIAAFLNTSGGILYIGVADDKTIVGVSQDGFENEDKFILHLTNEVKKSMGGSVASDISIRIEDIDGKKVCRISCEPSKMPIYLNHQSKESFYIRMGTQTIELSPRELIDYIRKRFKQDFT